MKIKTSELRGAALDWAVAKCEGFTLYGSRWATEDGRPMPIPQFSTDWAQGGPIMEREGILMHGIVGEYHAWIPGLPQEDGATQLIAAMRCYVASRLGQEVEIPEGLS